MRDKWKLWLAAGAALALTAGCGTTGATTSASGSASNSTGGSNGRSTSNSTGASASTASNQPTTLTLYISGDVNIQQVWQDHLIPLYEKSHPNVKVNIVMSTHGADDNATIARLAAGVKAHQNGNIDILEGMNVGQLAKANLVTHLTTQDIPMMAHINPSLLQQISYDGVPYRASSVVLAYNSQFVKNPPQTLAQVISWIKAHPGKFTYNTPTTGGSGSAFVTAVVNSQVPASDQPKLITEQDKSLESTWTAGLKVLHDLGPDVYQHGYYANGNTGTLNLLANQSIWMAPVWSDQSLSALADHQLPPTIKLIQLQPAFSGGPADLSIPANSPHKQAAEQLINWVLTSAPQSIIVNQLNGYPGVEWKYMPQSIQTKYASIASSYATGWNSFYSNDLNRDWQSQVAAQTSN
jgi:putative spermidine/putrescine transport system substrate-binding protein